MKVKPDEEVMDFKITCYRNLLKLRYWLAQYNIPLEWSGNVSRAEATIMKDIVEEDLKRSEQ